MSRLFYHTMQDNAGNLLFGVTGTMRLAGSGTLATIYGDEALTVILPNPMTNHPSFGSFKCFLPVGDYDFYMAKAGYTFETLTGVQGYGSMAQQNAAAVAITGGAVVGLTTLSVTGTSARYHTQVSGIGVPNFTPPTNDPLGFYGAITEGANRWNLFMEGLAANYLAGRLSIGTTVLANNQVHIAWNRGLNYGLRFTPSDDTSAGHPVFFSNAAGTAVGSITTTGAATAYNTTSDSRLKHAVTTLVGELALIRALRPVRFRWRANDAEGVGFLAHEVAEHVQDVVTGEPDAVDDEGQIVPQMIDMSRLVPWLVGAVQTLAAQVETLTERVAELEAGLGV